MPRRFEPYRAQRGAGSVGVEVHDRADRLTSEVRTGGPSADHSTQYAHDGNGNRAGVTRGSSNYPYAMAGANDRFMGGEGYSVGVYDADGNPSSISSSTGGTTNLFYDEASRVTSSTGGTNGELPLRRRRPPRGAHPGRGRHPLRVRRGPGRDRD